MISLPKQRAMLFQYKNDHKNTIGIDRGNVFGGMVVYVQMENNTII